MAVIDPVCSSNNVWYGDQTNRSVTDEMEAVKTSVSGKADGDHTHTGYAAANHTHDYAAASHEHTNYALAAHTHDLSGKADLVNGRVPESQLPSYVDDVVEAHIVSGSTAFSAGWLSETAGGAALTPEASKVYIVVTSGDYEGLTYRWSGSIYAPIGNDLALGETAATAYRGDHGKAAYDHSQNGTVHVTAAQKTAWDSKAAGDHDHDEEYILKALQMMADNGNVKYEMADQDVLAIMASMPCGMHTGYCPTNSLNAPKQTEAWRFLVHKTGTSKNYGWVMAFGSRGSVYSNYIDAGSWRGWKCIHDIEPEPLWSGAMYMTSGHTVEPTKTLSACRNGWMLLWSDYDPGEGENNYDFSMTMIPKRAYTGQKWAGGQFLCMVPCHFAADGHNHITKCLHIHDTKIVGHESNSVVDRNDVVLRAVYEF